MLFPKAFPLIFLQGNFLRYISTNNYLQSQFTFRAEECFANPDKFDPENFNESQFLNKVGFLGFGQGPRNCIGKL